MAALAPLALGFAGGLAVDEPVFYGAVPHPTAQDGPSSASPSSVELKGVWRKKKNRLLWESRGEYNQGTF